MSYTVTIVVPVLNEEATLATQITELRRYLDTELGDMGPISIIIADNGSSDRTRQIASGLVATMPHVGTTFLEERGVGRALKVAWSEATSDIVGYMDLDLATDLGALRPALQALQSNSADIVNGSRLLKESVVRGRKPLRNFTSRTFNMMVRRALNTTFTDGMCGFKFLRRDVFAELREAGATSDGWFFATQLLVAAERRALRVHEVPVTWTDDPNSKVSVLKLSAEYVVEIIKLRKPGRMPNHD
jgi:glycosyltransferase involved in cell wall biosynthesis